VPTSNRPQINNAQYPRISGKVLKGTSNEEIIDYVIAEVEAGETISILIAWSVETPKYPAWLQRVWQSHSRHADLRKVSKHKSPSTRKYLAGPSGVHPMERPSFLA
jgi:hypothetical protein